MAAQSGLASRLYRGEAGVNVIGKRNIFFGIAGAVLFAAIISFGARGTYAARPTSRP